MLRYSYLILAVACLTAACAQAPRRARGPIMPPRQGSMVLIDGATFERGTDSAEIPELMRRYGVTRAEILASEVPVRRVRLARYFMDRYEVTNREFAAFLVANPEWGPARMPERYQNGRYLGHWSGSVYPAGRADHPVTYVPWYAARAYCRLAGKRLPTESEWEYAARGGERGEEFPWGSVPPDSSRANWSGSGIGTTSPVGSYPPNGYGLFDMAGNVWEFTADEWGAAGSDGELRYAIRGGSFDGDPVNLRVRYRDSHPAVGAAEHVGFRCARDG